MYEIIYNRINSDLLMWEPSSPIHTSTSSQLASSLMATGMTESIYVPFSMCKSAINYESCSSATASESESDPDIFYSIIDGKKHNRKSLIKTKHSTLAFNLELGETIATMYTPLRVN